MREPERQLTWTMEHLDGRGAVERRHREEPRSVAGDLRLVERNSHIDICGKDTREENKKIGYPYACALTRFYMNLQIMTRR